MNEMDQKAFDAIVTRTITAEDRVRYLEKEIQWIKAYGEKLGEIAFQANKKLFVLGCLYIGLAFVYGCMWWWKG